MSNRELIERGRDYATMFRNSGHGDAAQLITAMADALEGEGATPVAWRDWQIDALGETWVLIYQRRFNFRHEESPSGLDIKHLEEMVQTAAGSDFSPAKRGRWLGWIQAAATAAGALSLEEAKEINRRCSDAIGAHPAPLTPDERREVVALLKQFAATATQYDGDVLRGVVKRGNDVVEPEYPGMGIFRAAKALMDKLEGKG